MKQFFLILGIALFWFLVSVYLILLSAAADDTMGKVDTIPFWLTTSTSIFLFPMINILDLFNSPKWLPEKISALFFLILIFVNSVIWGASWFYLFRGITRKFVRRKGVIY